MPLLRILLLPVLTQVLGCVSIDYTDSGTDWDGLCSSGTMQSPINLEENPNITNFPHYLFLNYPKFRVVETNNCPDQYYLMLTPVGEMIVKDNTTQSLAYRTQFVYWHSPSEHLLLGEAQSLEMQIVHSLSGGSTPFATAVLSILFLSDDNPAPNPFFQQIIDSQGELADDVDSLSFAGVISKFTTFAPYYYYQGSITVPPCSENVSWYVLTTPERMSSAQLGAFTSKWSKNDTFAGGNGNNRKVQPLNGRSLYVSSGSTRNPS